MPRRSLAILVVAVGAAVFSMRGAPRDSGASESLLLVHHRPQDRPLARRLGEEIARDAGTRALIDQAFVERFDPTPNRLATEVFASDGGLLSIIEGYVSPAEFERRLRMARDLAPAVARAGEVLARNGRDGSAWLVLGELHMRLGATAAARRELELAESLGAGPRATERLVRLEVEDGRIEVARSKFDAMGDELDGAGRRLSEALILLAERRSQEALGVLESLLLPQVRDEEDRVLFEIGLAAHEVGRNGRALGALDEFDARFGDSPLAALVPERRRHVLAPDHEH